MRTMIPVAVAIARVAPVDASDACTTSMADVDTGATPAGRWYYDESCGPIDPCGAPVFWYPHVYEESNGLDGLQRGDEVKDDTNGGLCYPHDTIIF